MGNYLTIVEASISVLAVLLTVLNYYISLRLRIIENRISRLENFERDAKKDSQLLHTINGKLDIILRDKK